MTKKKLSQSIMIALDGIAHGISTERNIKIQSLIGVLVIIASLLLRISRSDFIIILVVSFLVIICELMNTSLERLMDFLHSEHHEAIKRVKDMLAGLGHYLPALRAPDNSVLAAVRAGKLHRADIVHNASVAGNALVAPDSTHVWLYHLLCYIYLICFFFLLSHGAQNKGEVYKCY
jgi:diacylglycerol kinase